ncbi:MAG: trypsin-like peptidase domain-containing protein [Sedimentisphaerales bacterium]|nr:trypsin-like peptidase domain-containing protein [Sedimentisphaerales bacterium]
MKRDGEGKILKSAVHTFLLCLIVTASAQVCNGRTGKNNLPASFSHRVKSIEAVDVIVTEDIDLTAVRLEDKKRKREGGPERFAMRQNVQVNTETDGTWEQIDSRTKLWRFHIVAPQAKTLSLGFTSYQMPAGGKLFIYSADGEKILGPYTKKHNARHRQLWTPIISSDDILVELTIGIDEIDNLELTLGAVNYGYEITPVTTSGIGDSAYCEIDVVCPEGAGWEDQIRSVGLYQMTRSDGSYWCVGGLINNTAEDETPYFLTAFHCIDEEEDGVLADPNGVAASMVIYWNFQAQTCGGDISGPNQIQTGAYFCSAYYPSDFALVELDEAPVPDANVYYAGWDRNNVAPASGVAIHHPKADLKKISFENHSPDIASYLCNPGDPCAIPGDGTHLCLWHWEDGSIEPGSSGCPLFDPNKRVVGQCHGGLPFADFCDENGGAPTWFGFFYKSWTGGGTIESRLSDWLDPIATGQTTLDGKDAYLCTITGDFDCDKDVDFLDLLILADQWRSEPGEPSADIAPETPDGIVNMLDLDVFAQNWLEDSAP